MCIVVIKVVLSLFPNKKYNKRWQLFTTNILSRLELDEIDHLWFKYSSLKSKSLALEGSGQEKTEEEGEVLILARQRLDDTNVIAWAWEWIGQTLEPSPSPATRRFQLASPAKIPTGSVRFSSSQIHQYYLCVFAINFVTDSSPLESAFLYFGHPPAG